MKNIELEAYAKINLSLDVLSRREDGYHELQMIMQTIDVHDTVSIEALKDKEIIVDSSSGAIPAGNENIAYKAAKLLYDQYNIDSGVKIYINKRIPVAAGLAGGSTDAAAVLRGMNSLFALGIEEDTLMALGKNIGADVPYCIKGGTMLAEGIGEKLTPLEQIKGLDIVLIKPPIDVSTAWVYKSLNLDNIKVRPDTKFLLNAINNRDMRAVAENMANVLESVTVSKYRIVSEIKKKLMDLGALGSMMSGSGPSVFGVFSNRDKAKKAYDLLKAGKWDCFLTKTI